MRLLFRNDNDEYKLTKDLGRNDIIPPYAILSHTWLAAEEEPTFNDLINGTGKEKLGYNKIRFCEEQAGNNDLQHFWVDTCCINKSNEAELNRAIKSMFRWYRHAARCYVYLSDVSTTKRKATDPRAEFTWESALQHSRWFTRGWTLQELLAPASVEFFSREGKQLGNKSSLQQQIYEITGVPESALQGAHLSDFSDKERFSWMQCRHTKVEEDKAYSLLGIFDVTMPLRYGEGSVSAFKRLEGEIDKMNKCLRDLCLTNARDDKRRIEDDKGSLLKECYRWILNDPSYKQWRDDLQSPLLWISGDPGKGKTMLLCGIINELESSTVGSALLSYFFCHATHSRFNNAIAVLRGLIYMLIRQQPSLVSHIQEKYDHIGRDLFEDANAWVALCEIFTNILQDPNLYPAYLIIDALDECETGLPKLLDFLIKSVFASTRIKWIVSSRNWPSIEKALGTVTQGIRLCLEHNTRSMSTAVASYIRFKVDWLAERNKYSSGTRDAVQSYLSTNSKGTFLWVALVCQNLADIPRWRVQKKLTAFPPGLDGIYRRMIDQIKDSEDSGLCKQILAVVSVVHYPVTLDELASLIDMPEGVSDDYEALSEIVGLCGSFLMLRDRTISFVHQSAKDFLLINASVEIFPSGEGEVHHEIFLRSLEVMSRTLRRDIYDLRAPGYPIEQVKPPDPDPLKASRYSCVYWVDHLLDWNSHCQTGHSVDLQDGGKLDVFIRSTFLYWLEAVSLCRSVSKGVLAMEKLETLIRARSDAPVLLELVSDARRFIMYHGRTIATNPLQAYSSALIFSPTDSIIRHHFIKEKLEWITIKPASIVDDKWSACLQTLEGHRGDVYSVVFSPDSMRLASASSDKTVRIWDATSGECLQTLDHSRMGLSPTNVVFSPDSSRVVSVSLVPEHTVEPNRKRTLKNTLERTLECTRIWDAGSGECLQTPEGHNSVDFSPDSTRIASALSGKTVWICDAGSGEHPRTLDGHREKVNSVTFSPDSARIASASSDKTVRIWDAGSGECLRTLEGHRESVESVIFSPDSTKVASMSAEWGSYSNGSTIIWDAGSGECLQTLEGHCDPLLMVALPPESARLESTVQLNVRIWDVGSSEYLQILLDSSSWVSFSHDSKRLAMASDKTIQIYDADSGQCLHTLKGHSDGVNSIAFSPDSTHLASASRDSTVRIWDTSSNKRRQNYWQGDQFVSIRFVVFSPNSALLASQSEDYRVTIWDVGSGEYRHELKGKIDLRAFSHDSTRLVSISRDFAPEIWIWDVSSGECLQILEGHSGSIFSVTFSPDSMLVASASADSTVRIWDAASGECLQALEDHRKSVSIVAFSPDSARLALLASSANGSTVRIWDPSSGECLQILELFGGFNVFLPKSLAFSPDSSRLALALFDKTVRIFDTSSGECLRMLEGHNHIFRSVAFSPDSTRLASVSNDSTVWIWDTSSGQCLQKLHIGRVTYNISFDSTGSYLHTDTGTIALDILSTSNITPDKMEPQSSQYQGVALSSDGAWITYNSENIVWLPPEYRPQDVRLPCSAVSGGTIGIGLESGKVWMCSPNFAGFGS